MGTFFPDTQVEPRLAVDPTNSSHMVGAWQQERWDNGGSFGTVAAVTFDGGKTWTETVIPGLTGCSGGPFDRASDPWVFFGPTGTLYVSSLGQPLVEFKSWLSLLNLTDCFRLWSSTQG